jgi:hypothetical protein
MTVDFDGAVPECVRCTRSSADHDRRDDGDYTDVQRRIWRALGWPCAQFALTYGHVYAGNQAAMGRWDGRRRAPQRSAQASTSGTNPDIGRRGAARAREALGLTRDDTPEAS